MKTRNGTNYKQGHILKEDNGDNFPHGSETALGFDFEGEP